MTTPSCRLVSSPTSMRSPSPRTTVVNQTLDLAPMVTRPTRVAPPATHALSDTTGSTPSYAIRTGASASARDRSSRSSPRGASRCRRGRVSILSVRVALVGRESAPRHGLPAHPTRAGESAARSRVWKPTPFSDEYSTSVVLPSAELLSRVPAARERVFVFQPSPGAVMESFWTPAKGAPRRPVTALHAHLVLGVGLLAALEHVDRDCRLGAGHDRDDRLPSGVDRKTHLTGVGGRRVSSFRTRKDATMHTAETPAHEMCQAEAVTQQSLPYVMDPCPLTVTVTAALHMSPDTQTGSSA